MRSFILALLLATVSWGSASADVHWQVEESSESTLRLRVLVSGATLREVGGGEGSAWVAVDLPGALSVGSSGQPELPQAVRWFAVPPSGELRIESRVVKTENLGAGRVVPHPDYSLAPDDEGVLRPQEDRREAATYSLYRNSASDVVEAGDAVFHRRQRITPLRVNPVLYDAATRLLQVATEIEITIHFPRSRNADSEPGRVDRALRGSLLNPSQAQAWRCLSPQQKTKRDIWASGTPQIRSREAAAGVNVLDPALVLQPEIRVHANRSGIMRIRLKDLVDDHGFALSSERRFLRLVRKRATSPTSPDYPSVLVADVPFSFVGGADENATLNVRDELFFYARSAQDDWSEQDIDGDTFPVAMPLRPDSYNSSNVYFLLVMDPGTGQWARMQEIVLPKSTGTAVQSTYPRSELFTGDQGYRDDPLNPYIERYYWNDRMASDVERALRLVHPAGGSDLRVDWKAGGHISGSSTLNRFSLLQGGTQTLLTVIPLNNRGELGDYSRTLAADDFAHGPLSFLVQRFVGELSIGVNSFFSDVVLNYDALYKADNDQLEFHTAVAGQTVDLEVAEFTRHDLHVFDVTDPIAPKLVRLAATNLDTIVNGVNTSYTLSLNVTQQASELRRFVAATRTDYPRINTTDMASDPVIDLFTGTSDLQILAIGPEEFRGEMQRWVDQRNVSFADEGWRADYIDVQQIYDQFSGGLVSPTAIRAFSEYAYLQWQATALLLVGDANEDVREVDQKAGPNRVPPSLHLQTYSTISRELLASDKWYGHHSYAGVRYPLGLATPGDMLVGRLPVATTDELRALVDKILAYEQPSAGDTWRARTAWLADDAYSTDYLSGATANCYAERESEREFLTSQETGAGYATGAVDSVITSFVWNADVITRGLRVGEPCADLVGVRVAYSRDYATQVPQLMSQGWLMVSYQGHANYNVLGHENFLLGNQDGQLVNAGKPFIFFGMGCHVSDFLRSWEARDGKSLGEKLMMRPGAGAIATYGSSGFEFLSPNARLMEAISASFFDRGRSTSTILGSTMPSQWILADVLAEAELNILGTGVSFKDEMVSQYNLLGDPLLRIDAAPPRLVAQGSSGQIVDGAELVADAGAQTATVHFELTDEAGIDRLVVTDSEGRDYSAVVGSLVGSDPRRQTADVSLPIYPQDYELSLELYDDAYPMARPTTLTWNVPLTLTLLAGGEVIPDPQSLVLDPDVPQSLELQIESPVRLQAADIELIFEGVNVVGLTKSGSDQLWTLAFDATSVRGVGLGRLAVSLRGFETELRVGGTGAETLSIARHVPFPNPMQGSTRILVEVEGAVDALRLTVYDLAGRSVFAKTTSALGGAGTSIFIDYDARDRYGAELANGTYFYRVEALGPGGSARGDMGRLVIMR